MLTRLLSLFKKKKQTIPTWVPPKDLPKEKEKMDCVQHYLKPFYNDGKKIRVQYTSRTGTTPISRIVDYTEMLNIIDYHCNHAIIINVEFRSVICLSLQGKSRNSLINIHRSLVDADMITLYEVKEK